MECSSLNSLTVPVDIFRLHAAKHVLFEKELHHLLMVYDHSAFPRRISS